MERVLKQAMQQADAAEVYRLDTHVMRVEFRNNVLYSVISGQRDELALRLVKSQKMGFASCTAKTTEDLVPRALSTADDGPQMDITFPAQSEFCNVDNFDPQVDGISARELIDDALRIIRKIRPLHESLDTALVLEKRIEHHSILNSSGLAACYSRSELTVSARAQVYTGSDLLLVRDGIMSSHAPLVFDELLYRLDKKLDAADRTHELPTGRYPVLLAPKALQKFLMPLVAGLTAGSAAQFEIGQKVACPRVSVWNDPTRARSAASCAFDAEGVAATKTALVEDGVVTKHISDLAHAALAHAGSAVRKQMWLPPEPGVLNLYVKPEVRGRRELFNDVEYGLIVDLFSMPRPGYEHSRTFSADIELGYVISHGKTLGRCTGLTLRANVIDALTERLRDISGDQIDCGDALLPYYLLDDVEVVNIG